MKEQKIPLAPGAAETDEHPLLAAGPEGKDVPEAKKDVSELAEERETRANLLAHRQLRPASTMQSNKMQSHRTRGRLSRDTMKLLGKVLGDYFDHVRQQEVPDRITELVKRFEERKDKGPN